MHNLLHTTKHDLEELFIAFNHRSGMKLRHSLHAEFLRTRRAASRYFVVLAGGLISVITFFGNADRESIQVIEKDTLKHFSIEGEHLLNFAFIPILIVLARTLQMQIECRNNTWKRVISSPRELFGIFAIKFMIFHLMIILFLIAYNLFTIGTSSILDVMYPGSSALTYITDTKEWVFVNFQAYFFAVGLSAMLFCVAKSACITVLSSWGQKKR